MFSMKNLYFYKTSTTNTSCKKTKYIKSQALIFIVQKTQLRWILEDGLVTVISSKTNKWKNKLKNGTKENEKQEVNWKFVKYEKT